MAHLEAAMFAHLIIAAGLLTSYQETLYPEWSQNFSIDEMIYEEKKRVLGLGYLRK